MRRRAILGALAAACAGATARAEAPRPRSYKLLGQIAPPLQLPRRGGGLMRLDEYRGRVLVLYWWGLWCPDCVNDSANVQALVRAMNVSPHVAFLGVHARARFGKYRSVDDYFQQHGFSFDCAFDDAGAVARDLYKIEWFPTFLVIDGAGKIRAWRNELGGPAGVDAMMKTLTNLPS